MKKAVIALLLAAGPLWWIGSTIRTHYEERAKGEALFAAAPETPAALAELQQSSRTARLAFLRMALANPENAAYLRSHQQAMVVALSQVDRDEAAALFHDAVWPALRSSREPDVLNPAAGLMRAWSIADPDVAGELAQRAVEEADARVIEALLYGFDAAAPALSADEAAKIAEAFVSRMERETDPSIIGLLGGGMRRLDAGPSAGALAARLAARMQLDPDPLAIEALGVALEPWAEAIPRGQAAELAGGLMDRVAREHDPVMLDVLLAGVRMLAPAPEVAERLLEPMRAADTEVLSLFATSLGALGASAEQTREAAELLLERIRATDNAEAAAYLSVGFAALHTDATAVAANLVDRIEATRDPYSVALLATGLGAVRDGIPRTEAARLATRLGAYLLSVSDPAASVRVMLGLQAVADAWTEQESVAYARQVVERMRTSRGIATLRILAVALRGYAPPEAAEILMNRMEDQRSPALLLSLATGLAAMDAEPEERAVEPVLAALREESSVSAIATLVEALEMLDASEEAVPILVERVAGERDPARVRSLGMLLAQVAEEGGDGDPDAFAYVFTIPNAPCEIVAAAPEAALAQVRNPMCSQEGWAAAVLTLGQQIDEPLATAPPGEEPPRLEALAGVEDDDGETGEAADKSIHVDFNRLSDALKRL